MNKGDTVNLLLDYQINDEPLQRDAYQEIELQINKDTSQKSIKKTLSSGEIKWETVEYDGGTFEGYVVHLTQSETISLGAGQAMVQIRVKMNGEVGSSASSMFSLGDALSTSVL